MYTEQPDRGSRRSGGSKGNTHEDCIHSRRQVGEFGQRVVPTKTEAGRSPSEKDRGRETVYWGKRKKDGMSVVAVVAREKPRKGERERERETQAGTFA